MIILFTIYTETVFEVTSFVFGVNVLRWYIIIIVNIINLIQK